MSSLFVLFEEESDEDNEERPIEKINMKKRNYFHQGDRSTWLKFKRRLLSRRGDGTFHTATIMSEQSLGTTRRGGRFQFSPSGGDQRGSFDCTENTEMEDDIDSFQTVPVAVSLNEDDQSCEVELCNKSENFVQTISTDQKRRPKILNSFRIKNRQNKNEERVGNDAVTTIKISPNNGGQGAFEECCPYERTSFFSRKSEERKTSKSLKAFLGAVTAQKDQSVPPPPDYPPPPLNTIEAVRTASDPTKKLDQSYQLGHNGRGICGINRQECKPSVVETDAFIDTFAKDEDDLFIPPPPSSLQPMSSFVIRQENKEMPNTTRYKRFNEFKYERRRYNSRKEKEKKSLQRSSKSAREQQVALQQTSTLMGANLDGEEKLSNLFKAVVSVTAKF